MKSTYSLDARLRRLEMSSPKALPMPMAEFLRWYDLLDGRPLTEQERAYVEENRGKVREMMNALNRGHTGTEEEMAALLQATSEDMERNT